MNTFILGQTIICSVEVRNSANVLTSPANSMTIQILRIVPAPTTTVVSVTNMTPTNTGLYYHDFTPVNEMAGEYLAKYVATDGVRITSAEDKFTLK